MINEDEPQASSLIEPEDPRPSFMDGNAQEESNLNVPSRIDEEQHEYSEDQEHQELEENRDD